MKKRRNSFMNITLGVTDRGDIIMTKGPKQAKEIIEVIIPALLQMEPQERIDFFEEAQKDKSSINQEKQKNIIRVAKDKPGTASNSK